MTTSVGILNTLFGKYSNDGRKAVVDFEALI